MAHDHSHAAPRGIASRRLTLVLALTLGFVAVEVAAGLPVWVYGEYLRSTSTEKVLIVTGSSVNMRPQPQVSVANMPLGVKLVRGDRVEMIRRLDPGAPLESDWI